MFYLKSPKVQGGNSSKALNDNYSDALELDTVLYSGLMKIDYTSDTLQTGRVPLMKSEDILGYLTVEYNIIEVDVGQDSYIRDQLKEKDNLIKIASMTGNKVLEIRRVWKMIIDKVGSLTAGVILFKNIFAIAPGAQDYFPMLKAKTGDKI